MPNMEVQQERKIRIAICGGGIGGLCLAVALSGLQHLDVQLYESAGQFKEIGAGVMIWARTWRILERMGLAGEFSKIAHAPPTGEVGVGFDYRRSDSLGEGEGEDGGREGKRFKLVEMPYGCIRFHRAEFLDIFVNHLPPGIAHFGKRVLSYSSSHASSNSPSSSHPPSSNVNTPLSAKHSDVTLTFADGTTAACDILVGADGIKSTIRAQMFREAAAEANDKDGSLSLLRFVDPVWTGTMAYRGLIRVQELARARGRARGKDRTGEEGEGKEKDGEVHRTVERPMMYCGKNKHVVSYSISKGDIINVVTFASEPEKHGTPFVGEWVVDCPQQELLDCYKGWEPEVGELLGCIKNPTRWAIHHLHPLPFYQRKGVVLLGDSAHAMSPHQGAGAGQAIEDAFILAALLSQPNLPCSSNPSNLPDPSTLPNLSKILQAYETIRLPMANDIMVESYHSGMMYEFNSEYGEDYERLGPAIQRQWDWIDRVSLDEEVRRAVVLAFAKDKGKGKVASRL